jgi:hypothetical protein
MAVLTEDELICKEHMISRKIYRMAERGECPNTGGSFSNVDVTET